ncbi:MAG: YhdP family protein [Arenimonas sp.]
MDFDRLQADARWQQTRDGWRVQAPKLNLTRGTKVSHLDGLQIEGGARFGLRGRELDLSPLAAMLALSDRLPGELRLFLLQSNPQAVLRHVVISGRRNGALRGSMELSELSLQAYGNQPGLSGLAGKLRFDEHGGVFRIDSAPVRVDWPVALRQSEAVQLDGSLALWRNGRGWTLGTGGLRLRGGDFGARLRLALGFQGDGSAPSLDLAAELDPASVDTAKRFWILHRMPASTVHWLDTALVAGSVEDGRIAIGGDLDDWPFANHGGSFDARARLHEGTLKFNQDWPAGEHMELDMAFFGPGFSVHGSGELLGNHVASVQGGIDSFHTPWLKLDISADGPGEQLRQLMLHSPLEKQYGEHMRALTISGAATTLVQLTLPLREGLGDRHVDGSLELAGATLADSRWNLRFTGVSGRTSFNEGGFATENLSVRLQDEPGTFNLRVGDATGDKAVAALATLEGRFSAATLLDRDADLAWLKPWMHGIANWRVAVGVPRAKGAGVAPPAQLRLNSDLVGVEISMPAPLGKPALAVLPLELQAPLPVEQGEVNLRLGNLMRMRVQMKKDAALSGAIQFGEGTLAPSPAQGLAVRGRVPILDSTGWVAFAGKGGESKNPVHDVDVQADQLVFLDRSFANSRLQLQRTAALTRIVLKGKGIDGAVDVPNDTARGVQGRFASLFLPSDAGGQPVVAANAAAVDDPSSLPPLRFSIADLRIGQAQLGKAELQTSPMASGMRIDKFQSKAKDLSLDAAGEWIRSPAGSRSNFRVDFTAASLGQMLDALGYGDMVEGGRTRATLTGSWPGSPGDFGMATLNGTLKAEVGEGRLLDVEPGGSGRILGLLSLAEIPRRLSLDFSDFFKKGFAFNTVKGDFAFADGLARTDNLRIDGPAAEIRVSGTTGMREKVYDQRVEVLPKAGGLLPAIGLIAGGPAGAAVGAVAQAMFQNPLKKTTRVVYHVTGPWEKPVVKVIEKGAPRAAITPAADATAMEKQ